MFKILVKQYENANLWVWILLWKIF